jgi:uncharacterized membrane protein YhhN
MNLKVFININLYLSVQINTYWIAITKGVIFYKKRTGSMLLAASAFVRFLRSDYLISAGLLLAITPSRTFPRVS